MPERESESDRALVFSSEKNNRALLARAFFYICMYIYIYIYIQVRVCVCVCVLMCVCVCVSYVCVYCARNRILRATA